MTPPADEVWSKNLIYKLPQRKHPYIDKHTDLDGINVPDVMAWGGYGGIYTQVNFDAHPMEKGGAQFMSKSSRGALSRGQ